MNSGKNSRLEIRNSKFLKESFTSSGSAIRAYPTGPSTIYVEGVIFNG
jgi:hypothetical protein